MVKRGLLHEAIRNKNIEAVHDLILKGANVNAQGSGNYVGTPLHVAIGMNAAEIVKMLLNAGASPNVKNRYGLPAIRYALNVSNRFSNLEIAKILIDAGADVNSRSTNYDQSVLHYAVSNKDISMIQYLLSHGADVNIEDESKGTPIHNAVGHVKWENYLDVVEILLKNNANVNAQNDSKMTPLHLIVYYGNAKAIKLLLSFKAQVNVEDCFGNTPLFNAAQAEHPEIVQILIDYGADVNYLNSGNGRTPMHSAFRYYNKAMAKCLLKNGGNVNMTNFEGLTPLLDMLKNKSCVFTREKFVNMKKFIIFSLKYADLDVVDPEGQNILTINNKSSSRKTILEHLAKLKALDLPISSGLSDTILKTPNFNKYFTLCLEELSMAKSTKLHNSWVSFFNLLVDNTRKLKNYAGNRDLVEDFKNSDCKNKFPIYGALMECRMLKGIQKRKLFDESTLLFSKNCPIFNPTHLVTWNILDCLDNKYLCE